MLIENNITKYIDSVGRNVKAFITLVKQAIPKENTLFGAKLKFSFVVRMEMKPTGTPKDFKESIIQDFS
jgi:hypothetical protein